MGMMVRILSIAVVFLLVSACGQNDEPESIIREQTYLIHRATSAPISGTATVTELDQGKIRITIQLRNTAEESSHPAHLHFGSIAEVGELAFRLNDIDGVTGKSVTTIDNHLLENGLPLDYSQLLEMNGSIKIHMNDDYFKHMVLAFGNIGQNENYLFDGAVVCTGH